MDTNDISHCANCLGRFFRPGCQSGSNPDYCRMCNSLLTGEPVEPAQESFSVVLERVWRHAA